MQSSFSHITFIGMIPMCKGHGQQILPTADVYPTQNSVSNLVLLKTELIIIPDTFKNVSAFVVYVSSSPGPFYHGTYGIFLFLCLPNLTMKGSMWVDNMNY